MAILRSDHFVSKKSYLATFYNSNMVKKATLKFVLYTQLRTLWSLVYIWALFGDEVRILIFDDPTENERSQVPEFCSTQLNSNSY